MQIHDFGNVFAFYPYVGIKLIYILIYVQTLFYFAEKINFNKGERKGNVIVRIFCIIYQSSTPVFVKLTCHSMRPSPWLMQENWRFRERDCRYATTLLLFVLCFWIQENSRSKPIRNNLLKTALSCYISHNLAYISLTTSKLSNIHLCFIIIFDKESFRKVFSLDDTHDKSLAIR